MSTWQKSLWCLLCLLLQGAAEHCDDSLLQISQPQVNNWKTPRDLASNKNQKISWYTDKGTVALEIFSAIPSFGEHGNYVTLMVDFTQQILDHAQKHQLYCKGPGHRSKAEVFGKFTGSKEEKLVPSNRDIRRVVAFICQWPKEDALKETWLCSLLSI